MTLLESCPDILVLARLPVINEEPDCGLRFHGPWDRARRNEFLDSHGVRVRGIATSGKVPVDAALLDRVPQVEIIASFGVGYDQIDLTAVKARRITVTNTPDVLTEEVADLALGLLIATVRRIPQADRFVRDGSWTAGPFPLSQSLRGRTVGIVGLGRIGRAVARRLEAARIAVAYYAPHRRPGVSLPYYPSAGELAAAVGALVLCAPGGDATRGMIDAAVLAALGPGGVIVNVSRGSLVDEAALTDALERGIIAAAGLDVFADEPHVPPGLAARDDVVLLPHLGSATVPTRAAMGRLVLDNLVSWFRGAGPLTPIPETAWNPAVASAAGEAVHQ